MIPTSSSSLALVVCLLLHVSSSLDNGCKWNKQANEAVVQPEVYYINMDKSADRKLNMEKHLSDVGLVHHRVRGVVGHSEIYIPDDIEKSWRTAWCKLQTTWQPPPRKLGADPSVVPPPPRPRTKGGPPVGVGPGAGADAGAATAGTASASVDEFGQYSSFTTSLCGRGKKKNTPKELGCTTSHLVAMRQAVYSTSKSRYAIIVEDDVQFPFDVDWDAVARSAPPGAYIMQLFNSNEYTMAETWGFYVKNKQNLWTERSAKRFSDFWSTCAYMIDRVLMKDVVDKVIFNVNGWTSFNVVAGITSPCVPRECCVNGTNVFNPTPPCVYAPRGYQADSYLYSMAKTYMMNIPLIANGLGGNQSTFHQDHVDMIHRGAFRRQRQYVNEMLTGKTALPTFAKAACKPLVVDEM
jgi:GR25 family glycosyltransferase involved in LPS biosynthesis